MKKQKYGIDPTIDWILPGRETVGVGKADPKIVRCFPSTKFGLGEIHTQTVVNCRTKKCPLPDTLPSIRSSEKVSPRQGDPQSLASTNIIIQPKKRTDLWVPKRDEDKFTRGPLANCFRKRQSNEKAFPIS